MHTVQSDSMFLAAANRTKRVKASPRLVLAYRYLGLGPCQTAGESATRSWVRRVVQPLQKHTRNGISEPRFPHGIFIDVHTVQSDSMGSMSKSQ